MGEAITRANAVEDLGGRADEALTARALMEGPSAAMASFQRDIRVSLILIEPQRSIRPPVCLERAVERGVATEVLRAVGAFDSLAATFAETVAQCSGDFVLAVTPDAHVTDEAWTALTDAMRRHADADAFTLKLVGLPPDPAWRGRRCRSHERNLESLRFAHLVAPGALLARREAVLAALATVTPESGADWWRALTEALATTARFVDSDATLTRRRRLAGEPACPGFAPSAAKPRRVLVLGQIEASASLYFDFLRATADVAVSFRQLTRLEIDAPHLASADLVILVRDLRRFWDEGVIEFLRATGTPYVYFTDDNFLAMGQERGRPTFYVRSRMRRALAGARAVWVSTGPLAEAFDVLHPTVRVWGPVLDPALAGPAPRAEKLTIAIACGDFRLTGLHPPLVERLRAIAAAQPLRLILTRKAAEALAPQIEGAEVIAVPMERSFPQFVRQWRRFGVDVLLHPAGMTANAPFKCPTAAIVAGYLGAVPVVADEPAYDAWDVGQGVMRLDAGGEALARAAEGSRQGEWRSEASRRLSLALTERFGDAGRVDMLVETLGLGRRSGQISPDAVLGSSGFLARRAVLSVARGTRWVRDLARAPG